MVSLYCCQVMNAQAACKHALVSCDSAFDSQPQELRGARARATCRKRQPKIFLIETQKGTTGVANARCRDQTISYTNNGTYHDVALAGSLATDPPGLRGRVSLVFVIHSGGNEPPIFAALTL